MTILKLTAREWKVLDDLMECASDGRLLKRAYALRQVAEGDSIPDIATDLGMTD